MYDLVAVGKVLKELRKQIGKNQVQVAKELNIDASLDYIFGRTSIVDDEVTAEYNAVPEEKKTAVKDAMLTCIKLSRM